MARKQWLAVILCSALPVGFGPCNEGNVEVVNLNLLHGFDCDPSFPLDGDQCRVAERVDLLVDHIVDSGCPDLVTLQENVVNEFVQTGVTDMKGPLESTVALIEAALPTLTQACGFEYEVVFDPEGATAAGAPRGIDEELILTRYPALDAEVHILYSPLEPFFNRHVLRARIDHPVGAVDVYTTHLASSSDAGSAPCGAQVILPVPCPAECEAFVDTVRECQAKQLVQIVEDSHDVAGPAFVTGDFNADSSSGVYQELVSRGWIDSHLAAGNDECDAQTGENCTSGRSEVSGELEDPAPNVDTRIDYIFVVPPGEGSHCVGRLLRFQGNAPLTNTGTFADEPNPFAPSCGPEPDAICWPSDHVGNQANLICGAAGRG